MLICCVAKFFIVLDLMSFFNSINHPKISFKNTSLGPKHNLDKKRFTSQRSSWQRRKTLYSKLMIADSPKGLMILSSNPTLVEVFERHLYVWYAIRGWIEQELLLLHWAHCLLVDCAWNDFNRHCYPTNFVAEGIAFKKVPISNLTNYIFNLRTYLQQTNRLSQIKINFIQC